MTARERFAINFAMLVVVVLVLALPVAAVAYVVGRLL